jgi:F-type H+-transporting ATPase subunit delta
MINTTLAKRYAKALVEIGQQNRALEKYGKDLAAVVELVETSKDFKEVLVNPVFTKADKKRITAAITDKLGCDLIVRNFLNILIDKKRVDQLTGIEKAYRGKVDEIKGITRGEVISANKLSDEELGKIRRALSKLSGREVVLTTKVNPDLIGGIYAKVGDRVLDGTIRTQLNQLKESLKG